MCIKCALVSVLNEIVNETLDKEIETFESFDKVEGDAIHTELRENGSLFITIPNTEAETSYTYEMPLPMVIGLVKMIADRSEKLADESRAETIRRMQREN